MDEVYCMNCKYFLEFSNSLNNDGAKPAFPDCKKGRKKKQKNLPEKKVMIVSGDRVSEKNADNNCKDYKRLWWKIWIGELRDE